MKDTLLHLWNYCKAPVLQEDQNIAISYRFTNFFHLLLLCLITSFIFMPIFGILEELNWISMEEHAMSDITKKYPKLFIFFLVAVMAPLIEELIFRAPLTLFHRPKAFRNAFYIFAILFGLVHLSNYTNITSTIVILTPILVAPQLLLGFYFGYIRVRFGLHWSIALHATYNGILMLFSFIADF